MPLDVYTRADELVLLAPVPGMRPQGLEITAHQNTVTISGAVREMAQLEEAKVATWYVHELWSGQYRRSLTLPFEIDVSKAEARFEDGIVHVMLPKAERAKPQKITLSMGRNPEHEAIDTGSENGNGRIAEVLSSSRKQETAARS